MLLADILGMKKLIESRSLELIAKSVMRVLSSGAMPLNRFEYSGVTEDDLLKLGFHQTQGPIGALVSDGLLLIHPTTDELRDLEMSLRRTIEIFNALSCICSQNDIWVRGAFSFGDCYLENHDAGLIMLGAPIVEAFEWEKKQQWIGAILAPSAMQLLDQMGERAGKVWTDPIYGPLGGGLGEERSASNSLLARYNVPLKDGETYNTYAVNPSCFPNHILVPQFKTPTQNKNDAPDVTAKIKNTLDYFAHIAANSRE